jgi:DNA-binding transcriptional LysR family regulator
MDLDPRRMRILLAVARTGGVLAAADELRVTPSAVSQQLARLEREAGRPLLIRTPHGAKVTPAGRAVAEAAEEIERALHAISARLEHDDPDLQGTIRIGGFQSFLCAGVAPALPGWRARFPGLEFHIVEADQQVLLRSLRARELDIVIAEFDAGEKTAPLTAGTIEVPLLDEPWMLLVPSGTLLPADLDLSQIDLPWIGVEPSTGARALERVRRAVPGDRGTIHAYYEHQTALALVAAGEGLAVLPSMALRGISQDGVDAIQLPGLGMRRIVLRHRATTGASKDVIDALIPLIRDTAAGLASGWPWSAE